MNKTPRVCLIGDVLVDVTLRSNSNPYKLRLGGIAHAARGLWALGVNYSVGYFAPGYLDDEIKKFFSKHGCAEIIKLGNVTGSSYVILIEEVKEAGHQGYELLLRDSVSVEVDKDAWQSLVMKQYDDLFFISGNYNLFELLENDPGKSNLHIDIANNVNDLNFFTQSKSHFSTLFLSTSSNLFQKYFSTDFGLFSQYFKLFTDILVLKENRGGSRAHNFKTNAFSLAYSQTQPIVHSVGVGDVYDATFISLYKKFTLREAMCLSSWIASEYALTTYPDDFKRAVIRIQGANITDLMNLHGVSLPWEERIKINIYIAAPDFDYVNKSPIDQLVGCLEYHNFKPRRPVLENGQMELDATFERKQELFSKDIKLLEECQILIAVLLFNDPGTLLEIGFASAKRIPTIVYDPYQIANNCMLTQLPNLVSNDLDKILSEVFIQSNNILNHE